MPLKDGIVDGYGWTGYEVKRRKAAFGKEYEWTKQRAIAAVLSQPKHLVVGSSERLGKGCKGWSWKSRDGAGRQGLQRM